jgi:hypothetical protein
MQAALYWRDYYQNPVFETTNVTTLRTIFDLRSMVIHVGLLMGALTSFLLQKYDLGQTEHGFMFGFMEIKTGVDLWAAWRRKS